jgi:hypothetical protein
MNKNKALILNKMKGYKEKGQGRAGPTVASCSKKYAQTKSSRQNGPRVLFIG